MTSEKEKGREITEKGEIECVLERGLSFPIKSCLIHHSATSCQDFLLQSVCFQVWGFDFSTKQGKREGFFQELTFGMGEKRLNHRGIKFRSPFPQHSLIIRRKVTESLSREWKEWEEDLKNIRGTVGGMKSEEERNQSTEKVSKLLQLLIPIDLTSNFLPILAFFPYSSILTSHSHE